MKVLVCGANGFIGNAIATRLEHDGHQVVRGVRRPAHPSEIAVDYTTDVTVEQWLPKLVGIEAVINSVGIIVERNGKTFDRVHTKAPIALFEACAAAGVRRVIQMSALGAESRDTPYFASKCAADDFLLAQPMQSYVIRAALVYGTAGSSASFFRTIASLPVHVLPAGGHQLLRPIHIDDLIELVARLLAGADDTHYPRCIEAVGRTQVSYREMLSIYRGSMGLGHAPAFGIPAWIVRSAAIAGDRIPGSMLTSDTWRMLQRGNTADAQPIARAIGHAPLGIERFIDPSMAPVLRADALAAWRGLLLRVALAIVWMGSALVSAAIYPHAESLARLERLRLHGIVANVALFGASALDFVFGAATLLRPGRRLWLAQMSVILAYSALIAVALPEFLIDPFGPILKNVPILAVLILLFSEETRP